MSILFRLHGVFLLIVESRDDWYKKMSLLHLVDATWSEIRML